MYNKPLLKMLFALIITIISVEMMIMLLLSTYSEHGFSVWLVTLIDATATSLAVVLVFRRLADRAEFLPQKNTSTATEWAQLKIGSSVFVIESIIMLSINLIQPSMPEWQISIINTIILSIISALVIYFIFLKPFTIISKEQNHVAMDDKLLIITNIISYISLMILFFTILANTYVQQHHDIVTNTLAKESNQLVAIRSSFIRQLNDFILDLRMLASQSELMDVIKIRNPSSEQLRSLQNDYLNLARLKIYYQQIRYVNKDGFEIVRINSNKGVAEIVDASKLQNKQHRYYFKNGLKLKKGEIYISPIDLNIENGEIEIPYRPMIRIVTPVYSINSLYGVVIININAHQLFNSIDEGSDSLQGSLALFNENGYWIYGAQSEKHWGFMFSDKKDMNYAQQYPDEWNKMTTQQHVAYESDHGLIVSEIAQFKPITHKNNMANSADSSSSDNIWPRWILQSIIPKEVVLNQSEGLFDLIKLLYISALIIFGVATILLTKTILKGRRAESQVRYLAFYDSLTGLSNRRLFYEMMNLEISHARRDHHNLALLYIDLDYFKPINDELGHIAGDLVLKEVAKRIKACIRITDIAARLGGDEFAIIQPKPESLKDIETLAQRLLASFEKPVKPLGNERFLGMSIGVSILSDSDSTEDLIRRADSAMYDAKAMGRNCYKIIDDIGSTD